MFDQALPASLKAFAEREFLGERLIWAERPDKKIAALASFGIWAFAVPWTVFALFWESAVAGPLILDLLGYDVPGKPPGSMGTFAMWAMAIFGIPFVLIGFGMLLSPAFVLWKASKTLYVLTDKRVAVLESGRAVSVTSLAPSDIVQLTRKEGPDGRGTLTISQGFGKDSDGDLVERKQELGVIHDVRRVEQLVRDLKERVAR